MREYAGAARRKRSEGKVLWPGRKQVYRHYDSDGRMIGDVLTIEGDPANGEALIQPVMRAGQRLAPAVPLSESRARALRGLKSLPEALKKLDQAPAYPVRVAEAIEQLARAVDEKQFHSRDQQSTIRHSLSEQAKIA